MTLTSLLPVFGSFFKDTAHGGIAKVKQWLAVQYFLKTSPAIDGGRHHDSAWGESGEACIGCNVGQLDAALDECQNARAVGRPATVQKVHAGVAVHYFVMLMRRISGQEE